MKILITSDLFVIKTNGVVTSLKNLWDELKKKGHEVRILTLSEDVHSHKDGDVYFINSIPLRVYPDVRTPLTYRHPLITELIDWKPDIIHSQCEFFSFQFALYISKKCKAPIIHTYHTLYEQYVTYVVPFKGFGSKVVQTLSRKRLKSVHTIIAPTTKVEQTLKNYGIKNRIKVVPSGISLNQHKQRLSEEERTEKRNALGIYNDKTVLINLGRLGTEKNLDELIRFFAKAVKENNNLIFLIVGDGPAREELAKLSEELGISKNVIFTGMVAPTEVSSYYQLGDIFVSASTSETQGLTYIEASANRLPLLCRDDPCLDGIIIQGVNGYTYTSQNDFNDYLKRLSSDPEARKLAGEKSAENALRFDKSVFGDSVEKIYLSALNKK